MTSPALLFVLKTLGVPCVLCASVVNALSLDREAFSFTNYDLNVQVDPELHRLGARGKVTLRNDTPTPQKIAVMQISSSLAWRSIKSGDRTVQFVTQPYASDIDHTGALSEAIVTLPEAIASHGTIELDIAYEGVIQLDATRFTRIGTPEDAAARSDWDQISLSFTAVRGAGYVAWYPIATEVANLSEGDSLFEVLARWKAREDGSQMHIGLLDRTLDHDAHPLVMVCSGKGMQGVTVEGTARFPSVLCSYHDISRSAPSFALGNFGVVDRASITVYNLPAHAVAAESYADTAGRILPLIIDWFGNPREKAKTADLPDPDFAPFESGSLLMTSLTESDSKAAGLSATHQLTHASFISFRPWIEEGLAHFAQALYLEQQKGRQAGLDYMSAHRSALNQVEQTSARPEDAVNRSLVNTINEELYRSKAMCVWWMLRDMIGDSSLKKALADYRPEQDKEPSYMPRLISAQTQRDLEWFFDDWVYRDRGLPDFKVESAFSRKTLNNSFILAVTIDNLGTAGAEVPVIVKFAGGEVTKRLEVHAKDKATIRIETPGPPQEVVVNDGSVPESHLTNNTFKVESLAGN
jgi:hypothetical protein